MKTSPKLIKREEASVIVAILFVVIVLTTFAGSALFYASNKRLTINEACNWEESLLVAENGINAGVASIESSTSGTSASSGSNWWLNSGTYTLAVSHGGGSVTSATANYSITKSVNTQFNRPYYKVRSTGIVRIPGSKSNSLDSADTVVRKLNLGETFAQTVSGITLTGSNNRTAARTVEVWVVPTLTTDAAIATVNGIDAGTHIITVDAFNSTDPTRNTGTNSYGVGQSGTTGQFTAAIGTYDANLATTGTINAGGATVYGDALTSSTGAVLNSQNVYGSIRTDYSQSFATLSPDTALANTTPGVATSKKTSTTVINTATTLSGGTQANPGLYVVSSVTLAGNQDILTFDYGQNGQGSYNYNMNYIELWVQGDLSTKGSGGTNGSIIINSVAGQPPLYVTIYVSGNVALAGNSITNTSTSASSLTLIGTATSTSFDFGGTTSFYGTVYAPTATFSETGNAVFTGAVVAKSATLGGNVTFEYDAALAKNALITGFKPVTWFEDTGTSRNSL